MLIRNATGDDWPAVWPIVHRICADGETYTYPRDIGEEQARALWMLRPPARTVVAVGPEGTVLGTAKMNPNQMGPGAHISNASFMVDPTHTGRGVGRALVEDALAWARGEGYRGMQFNAVTETNTRAITLYRALGFEVIGTVPDAFHHPTQGYVGLNVMFRRL